MSTSVMSHYSQLGYDLDNSVQNQIMNDHLAVGAPIGNRNFQIGTFNSGNSAFVPVNVNANYSSTIAPPSTMNMLSTDNHRKLDRSWSEPCERSIRNVTPTALNTPNGTSANVNSSRYKTELCRPFEENGHCKYGDKCQFAHGKPELQNLSRHPKYKTDLCRTFHTIGFCPYGPRCHFIHSEEERKLVLKQQAAAAAMNSMVQHPGVIQRPNSIKFTSLSSLGSSLDSPTSSVNVSPTTLSPSFFGSGDDIFSSANHTSFSPNTQQSVSSGSSRSSPVFSNPELDWMTPLNVQTSTNNDISALQHQFTGMNLNQQKFDANQNVFDGFLSQVFRESQSYNDAVPSTSPVDSLSGLSVGSTSSSGSNSSSGFGTCNSPMEVSRGMRLPIFNRLSQEL